MKALYTMSLTVIKPLKKAWKIGGIEVRDVEFREPTVADLIAAEQDANPSLSPNAYTVALACETIVRAGSYTGPFAPAQFNGMSAANFSVIREAMAETSNLGED